MNRLFSLISIICMVVQPYTAIAQAPVSSPSPSPVASASSTSVASVTPTPAAPFVEDHTFTLNQSEQAFELDAKEVEPIYENQQVPDTCYQSVQRGTKTECHTEYDQSCSTRMENECQNIPYPVCNMVPERVCEDVPRRSCQTVNENVCETVNDSVCHTENENVCTSVPRQSCQSQNVCHTEYDEVCDPPLGGGSTSGPRDGPTRGGSGSSGGGTRGGGGSRKPVLNLNPGVNTCRKVPRQVCSTQNVCSTHNEQVCHSEPRRVCENVPRRQCHTEPRQSCSTTYDSVCHTENRERCHDEYRQECQQVPRQSCVDVPRQACEQVPNMVSEPYACSRTVRVQVGERTKRHTSAAVKIIVTNFGKNEVNADEFNVKIDHSATKAEVKLKLEKNAKKMLYRLVKKELTTQVISDIDQRVLAVFYIETLSLEQLNALSELKVVEPKLGYYKLEFKLLNPALNSDISGLVSMDKGALEVVRVKGRRLYTIIDDEFDPALVLKKTDYGYAIEFTSFDIRYLNSNTHKIHLGLSFKSTLKKDEFLNPELLTTVSIKPVVADFEAFPTE